MQKSETGRGSSSSGSATDQEVLGSNPTESWAFFSVSRLFLFLFLFSFLSFNRWRVLSQVPHGGATLLFFNFPRKNNS